MAKAVVELTPCKGAAMLVLRSAALREMRLGCDGSTGCGRFRRQSQRKKSKMIRLRIGTAKAKLANLKKNAIQVIIPQTSSGNAVWNECANQAMVRSADILLIVEILPSRRVR